MYDDNSFAFSFFYRTFQRTPNKEIDKSTSIGKKKKKQVKSRSSEAGLKLKLRKVYNSKRKQRSSLNSSVTSWDTRRDHASTINDRYNESFLLSTIGDPRKIEKLLLGKKQKIQKEIRQYYRIFIYSIEL